MWDGAGLGHAHGKRGLLRTWTETVERSRTFERCVCAVTPSVADFWATEAGEGGGSLASTPALEEDVAHLDLLLSSRSALSCLSSSTAIFTYCSSNRPDTALRRQCGAR